MKLIKPFYLLFASLLLSVAGSAQNYQPVTITSGFNQDVIASGIGDPAVTSTTGVDTFDYVLTTLDFQLTADAPLKTTGLPTSGTITSLATPGITYQFAPYTGNNSLKLNYLDGTGTLVFAKPVTSDKIYMLVTSGSGVSKLNYTINFSDGTTQSKSDISVGDWLEAAAPEAPIAIKNLARIERLQKYFQTFARLQLYEVTATILPANAAKQAVSITYSNTGLPYSNGVTNTLNVFAITAQASCATPNNVAMTVCNGATFNDITASGAYKFYASATAATAIDNATFVTQGIYYISHIVGDCESNRAVATITVTTQPQPEAAATQSFCESENATIASLIATPVTGATITWSTTANGTALPETSLLTAGTYYVTQTLNACTSAPKAIEVIINAMPNAPTGDAEQNFTEGNTVADFAIIAAAGATLQWYIKNDANQYVKINADTVVTDGTTYYVAQTTNNCDSDYFAVKANKILGANAFVFNHLTLYPNPAINVVTITNNVVIDHITITNMLGQKLSDSKVNATNITLSTANLPSGTYVVQIQSGQNTKTLKLIKQ